MSRVRWKLSLVVGAAVLTVTGCSSSKSTPSAAGSTPSAAGGVPTITIGVLTDISGVGGSPSVLKGIEAGVGTAGSEGYKIKYVVGDTQSSPTGALTAAQKLVEEDHVFAVVAISGLTFSAAPFLTRS